MFFRPKHYAPFHYPDGQPVEVGDALLWGRGGFYPGRVLGFVRSKSCADGWAEALRIDEGKAQERLIPADGFDRDDLRLVERRTRDHRDACVRWLAERISQGNAHTLFVVGCLYREGHTFPADAARAGALFERAIERGHPLAMVELALMLDAGTIDGRRVPLRAVGLMERAAAMAVPSAQQWLSVHVTLGTTPPEAFTGAALRIAGLERCAHQDDVHAMFLLGEAFAQGEGVDRDEARAAAWYARAVDGGSRLAMCNLATLYEKGLGVPQDLERARSLYEAAAAQNVLAAHFSLGEMHRDGRGVPRNLVEARAHLERAASQGFAPALAALERFPSP